MSYSGNLSDPGIRPSSLVPPALQADSLPLSHQAIILIDNIYFNCTVSEQRSLTGYSPWGHKGSDTTDTHVPGTALSTLHSLFHLQ